MFDSRDDLPADSILEYRSLYHGKMVCVMYEEHPLAKHKTVTLEQINGEVLILLDMAHISARMTTAQELIRQKCPQAVYYFSSSSEHALPMIQGHVGLAVMPDFVYVPLPGLTAVPLEPVLQNPVLTPAFNNVVAALFGALGCKYYVKGLKIAILPFILMSLLCIFVPSVISNVGFLVIPSGLIAIGVSYLLFKKNRL